MLAPTIEETTTLTEALALLATGLRIDAHGSYRDQRAYLALVRGWQTKAQECLDGALLVATTNGPTFLAKPKVGMGATRYGWTDSHPYEVVKVISDRCVEIRPMNAVIDPKWKADFTPGGFCGHVHNNGGEWILSSNPEASTIRIRLNKNGVWVLKGERYSVGKAIKFYDSNF